MATIPFVSNFKGALTQSGARANLFQIDLGIASNTNTAAAGATPNGLMTQPEHKFWVKAGQVPGSTESILPINSSGGRVLKIPGLRTFDDWTCTIINDEKMAIRRGLIDWMVTLSGGLQGTRAAAHTAVTAAARIREDGGTTGYKTQDITIKHFDSSGVEHHEYKMVKAWPNAIADIPLDWSTDGIEEFTVTFSYDYWTHTSNAITVETTGNVKVAAASAATSIDVESPTTVTAGIVS